MQYLTLRRPVSARRSPVGTTTAYDQEQSTFIRGHLPGRRRNHSRKMVLLCSYFYTYQCREN